MKKCDVGGQAVIEGVMMRGRKGLAIAVRKDSGDIDIKFEETIPVTKKHKVINIPFVRGIFVLIDSLKTGIKCLNYSSSLFDETEPSKFEDWLREKFGDKTNDIVMGFSMFLGLIMAIGLFVAFPSIISSLFEKSIRSSLVLNIIEAIIRAMVFILYIVGISKMEDMYRVFQYHGAEHKTIFCYEAEEKLTVENVKKFSRFHPRCGTNFLFLIMFVSIFVFSFTGWGGIVQRILLRILLIPVVSGISYEIIKWLGKSESKLSKLIAYPGLQFQKLTTKDPDDDQIEVAIASLMAAEGIEEEKMTIGELINLGTNTLLEVDIDTARLDSQLILGKVLEKDKLYLMINSNEEVSKDKKEEYLSLINKRKEKMPVRYILGQCDFMGLDFYVEEGVLIPRSDTEVLVEEVLKLIGEDESIEVCDLCSGSGAIGIALAHYRKNIKVDAIDYYPIPEKITTKNIEFNKVGDRVTFIKSDLLEESIKANKKYKIIVSNPPYIKEDVIETLMDDVKDYEPRTALSGGDDGLIFYRRIVEESKQLLLNDGILSFEIGHDQGEEVKTLMEQNGFRDVTVIKDLAGLDRVVLGKFNY